MTDHRDNYSQSQEVAQGSESRPPLLYPRLLPLPPVSSIVIGDGFHIQPNYNQAANNLNANKKTDASQSSNFISEACILHVPVEEIIKATNHFQKELSIGKGGFGEVFKFQLKNTTMAVKRLTRRLAESSPLDELRALNIYRHPNILSLYGYSFEGERLYLICQFMPNGSLYDQLHESLKSLNWFLRVGIATGSARGIQYLHLMNPPLIHGDIKSPNILLDETFVPKIGDFGLARTGAEHQLSHAQGTSAYLPEEYRNNYLLSARVDVYSFGIVLFEIATGLTAVVRFPTSRRCQNLREYVYSRKIDPMDLLDTKAGPKSELYLKLLELGKQCTSRNPQERPTMESVYLELSAFRDQIHNIEREYAGNECHWNNLVHQYIDQFPNLEYNILTKVDMDRLRQGLGPSTFHAFLLYENSDKQCAEKIRNKLEMQYKLRICDQYRDLIQGHPLDERSIIMRLLTERHFKLVAILSENFGNSKYLNSILNHAQTEAIYERVTIIPCIIKHRNLPSDYKAYVNLDYENYGNSDIFWDKLYSACIKPLHSTAQKSDRHPLEEISTVRQES